MQAAAKQRYGAYQRFHEFYGGHFLHTPSTVKDDLKKEPLATVDLS